MRPPQRSHGGGGGAATKTRSPRSAHDAPTRRRRRGAREVPRLPQPGSDAGCARALSSCARATPARSVYELVPPGVRRRRSRAMAYEHGARAPEPTASVSGPATGAERELPPRVRSPRTTKVQLDPGADPRRGPPPCRSDAKCLRAGLLSGYRHPAALPSRRARSTTTQIGRRVRRGPVARRREIRPSWTARSPPPSSQRPRGR